MLLKRCMYTHNICTLEEYDSTVYPILESFGPFDYYKRRTILYFNKRIIFYTIDNGCSIRNSYKELKHRLKEKG